MNEVAGNSKQIPKHVFPMLLVGLFSISVSAILIRWASGEAPAEALAVWRTIFASLILLPFSLVKARDEIKSLSLREILLVVVSGVFLGLHFIFWMGSLYHTSVASASVLVSLSPIFLTTIGFLILKERPTKKEIVAIIIATAGTILLGISDQSLVQETGTNPLKGNAMALFAALLISVYLLIGRVVRQKRSWLAYVAPLYVVTALTTLTIALLSGTKLLGYSWETYGLCLLMAIIPQLLGHGSLNYAVRFLPAATIGLASLFEPIGASVLAFLLFGESPTALGMVTMVIILLSVSVAIFRPKPSI